MSLDAKSLQSWFVRSPARTRTPALGERELAVLDVLWRQAPQTAQEIQGQMSGQTVSLSTVQSTLERLHRKGVLERSKRARAFYYDPKLYRHEIISSLLRDMADDFAGGDLAPMVSGFMDFLGPQRSTVSELLDARELDPNGRPDESTYENGLEQKSTALTNSKPEEHHAPEGTQT